VHQRDLLFDYYPAVLLMFEWHPIEIKVLWINRFVIEQLIQFAAQIFEPIAPLGITR
jgi:hypothetical protein